MVIPEVPTADQDWGALVHREGSPEEVFDLASGSSGQQPLFLAELSMEPGVTVIQGEGSMQSPLNVCFARWVA